MALEVKMKRDEVSNSFSSGSESVIRVLRGMLRTGYGFAHDIPEKIHIYCAIGKNGNSADFDVLFSVKNKLYTPLNIHESNTEVEWDMSRERLISLHQYLGNDLFNKIVPSLKASFKSIPDAILTSYDIEQDTQTTFFSYGVHHDFAKDEWRKNLESAEDGLVIDMVEFDYLNIDERF